jgi:hypothetical protein
VHTFTAKWRNSKIMQKTRNKKRVKNVIEEN